VKVSRADGLVRTVKRLLAAVTPMLLVASMVMLSNVAPARAQPSQPPPDLQADGAARLLVLKALMRQMNTCLPKPLTGINVFYDPPNQNAWRPRAEVHARGVDLAVLAIKNGETFDITFGTQMFGMPSESTPTPMLLIRPLSPERFPGTRLPDELIQSWDADVAVAVECFNQSGPAADPSAFPTNGITPEALLQRMSSCLQPLPPPVPLSDEERATGLMAPENDEGAFGIERGRPGIVNAPHTQHPDDLELRLVFPRHPRGVRPAMGVEAFSQYSDAVFSCFLATSAR
jgi:hypothetical protein